MFRKALIAGSILAAIPGATDAQSYESNGVVKVGLIDVAGSSFIGDDKNSEIEYRVFSEPGMTRGLWPMKENIDHGQVMAETIRQQVRAMDKNVKLKVFSANVMYTSNKGENYLMFNNPGAVRALDWFAANDVKVVMTTFVGSDTSNKREFMAEAKRRNMIVFASAGNDVVPGKRSYPAAYPDAISIVGYNPKLGLRNDASVASWVNFAIDGKVKISEGGFLSEEVGSSMAVARAVGIGAYAVSMNKANDTADMRNILSQLSTMEKFSTHQESVSVPLLDFRKAGQGLRLLSEVSGSPAISNKKATQQSLPQKASNVVPIAASYGISQGGISR